jgi:hypothetical protein
VRSRIRNGHIDIIPPQGSRGQQKSHNNPAIARIGTSVRPGSAGRLGLEGLRCLHEISFVIQRVRIPPGPTEKVPRLRPINTRTDHDCLRIGAYDKQAAVSLNVLIPDTPPLPPLPRRLRPRVAQVARLRFVRRLDKTRLRKANARKAGRNQALRDRDEPGVALY